MANAYTDTAALSLDTAAYNRLAFFSYRPQLIYDAMATVKATNQTHPGSSVIFYKPTDLAVATTTLSETVDVDAVALADATVTVTLNEYGNAAITTAKVRATSYIEVDPVVANIIGFNMGQSMNRIARDPLVAGTNVRYGGDATSRATVDATDTLDAADVRRAFVELRENNVPPLKGNLYASVIHPRVAYDLRTETGAAAWRDPHVYSQPNEIWNGEIGAFEGFAFVEDSEAAVYVNAGNLSVVDVYATLFLGGDGLAKAEAIAPHVVIGPVTDKLKRFQPIGWYALTGYGRFREEAIRRVESASSIGANV